MLLRRGRLRLLTQQLRRRRGSFAVGHDACRVAAEQKQRGGGAGHGPQRAAGRRAAHATATGSARMNSGTARMHSFKISQPAMAAQVNFGLCEDLGHSTPRSVANELAARSRGGDCGGGGGGGHGEQESQRCRCVSIAIMMPFLAVAT